VKALALGARAVGIGRPVLYGLAGYGQDGVERVLELLKDELEVAMRLMGTPTLADIKPEMICTKNISDHFAASPKDYLSLDAYIPLSKL
jgi:L-lactate dehydrogenase (cytochrome)